MSAFPLTRVPTDAPKPAPRARKPRVAVTTIATVTVLSPGSRAALRTAQSLGRALRCELGEGGQLHIWTEEVRP